MVAVVRRNKTEHESNRESEQKARSKTVCGQMQAESAIYFSCQMKSALCFFPDGFPCEFSCVLMIACVCFFMFMMQVLLWLNEYRTINKSLNAWIGYYAMLLSISLWLRRNRCCASVILRLPSSLLLYLVTFKVLRPNLCRTISS